MRTSTRRPRECFEKKLAGVIERVEREGGVRSVAWKPRLAFEDPSLCQGVFAVTGLYLFGSFARGAAECGDLDIIVEVEMKEGFAPSDSVVKGATTGHIRDADVLIQWSGTPRLIDEMEERTEVLIWSPTDTDWRGKLTRIQVGGSGRFDRKIDRLPPVLDRVLGEADEAEQLAADIERGVYSSEWVPLDSIAGDGEPCSWEVGDAVTRAFRGAGRKTTELLPRLVRFVNSRSRTEPHLKRSGPGTANEFHLGAYHIHVGSPRLRLGLVDHADTGSIALS